MAQCLNHMFIDFRLNYYQAWGGPDDGNNERMTRAQLLRYLEFGVPW